MRYLIVALMLAAPPLYAAGPAQETTADAADVPDAQEVLPRSMVPQGVIGHIEPEDGYSLFDSDVLISMRKNLIGGSDPGQ